MWIVEWSRSIGSESSISGCEIPSGGSAGIVCIEGAAAHTRAFLALFTGRGSANCALSWFFGWYADMASVGSLFSLGMRDCTPPCWVRMPSLSALRLSLSCLLSESLPKHRLLSWVALSSALPQLSLHLMQRMAHPRLWSGLL